MKLDRVRETERAHIVPATSSDVEKKVVAILKVLSESSEPLGSITIARELERHGVFLGERAVRYHLKITDERGYTLPVGHDGRMITPEGYEELELALAPEQIGFINERLELLAFNTTFDPKKKTGNVPINVSLIPKERYRETMAIIGDIFKAELCVSSLVMLASEGEKLGSVVVPEGKIGLATICSVVINGVLLKAGVPVNFRFGGVLEVKNHKPRRFVAVISYSGTSLDPSEQYIRAHMTRVGDTVRTGNGRILANFREMPAPARAVVEEKAQLLREAGINGVYVLGNASDPVCRIPVNLNRVGMVLLGGLNPVAAAVESGIEIDNISESGMVEFSQLVNFQDICTE